MAKKMSRKDAYAIEVGARLRNVIDAFYGSVNNFAEKSKIIASTLSRYLNGSLLMSDKTANTLQVELKINKDYLFNGNLPMLLTDEIKPIKEHLVRKIDKSVEDRTKQIRDDASRSLVKQMILLTSGKREVLSENGMLNIIDFAFSGAKEPLLVSIISLPFCEKYNLSIGCSLMIGSEYQEGEIVFVDIDGDFILAEYYKEKLVDIADQTEYNINGVNIIGKACKKIEIF